jgi:hypothetical protein
MNEWYYCAKQNTKRKSEINDDDEQDTLSSKIDQERKRDRDQRSNITRNNNKSTYNNNSFVNAKKWSIFICKEKEDSRSKNDANRFKLTKLQWWKTY